MTAFAAKLDLCTTGDAPDGWTPQLVGTGAAFAMQSGSGIRMTTGTGFNGGTAPYSRRRLNYAAGRLFGVVVFSSLAEPGFFFTASVGANTGTRITEGYSPGGYCVKLEPQAGSIEVSRESAHSVLQTVTGLTYASRMAFEVECVGTRVRARTWDESLPQPGWQCDFQDTAASLGADDQWVGIGWKCSSGVSQTVDLARLTIDDLYGAIE